ILFFRNFSERRPLRRTGRQRFATLHLCVKVFSSADRFGGVMKNALIATFLIVIAVYFIVPAEADEPAIRHTVLVGGNKAGTEIGTKTGDEWHYSFEYNDRGRGPKTETRIVIGPGQIPVLIENTGVDYYKNAVTEKFSLQDGKATWKNQSEDGSKSVSGKAFFIPMNSAPEETNWLTRALLAAPDHKLALLPDGEASIEKASDLQVQAKGQSLKVTQYRISGLGLMPQAVWLQPNGDLFAIAGSWYSVVLDGWEDSIPALLTAQDQVT